MISISVSINVNLKYSKHCEDHDFLEVSINVNQCKMFSLHSVILEKTFKTVETNCKLYTAKYTKRSNGMAKHPSTVLSTMQLEVTIVKIEVTIITMLPF